MQSRSVETQNLETQNLETQSLEALSLEALSLEALSLEALASERLSDSSDLELADRILSRIESRLPGRVRQLAVDTTENDVVLTGECCTFYTKQLAQHIAMGVLEYEQLINNIDVRVSK